MSLTPVPTLDELAAHPERIYEIPPRVAADILIRVLGLQTVLLARAMGIAGANGQPQDPTADQLLTVEQAARKLSVSGDWVYRRARTLPFIVHLGSRLRCSERGIERYIRQRQGR